MAASISPVLSAAMFSVPLNKAEYGTPAGQGSEAGRKTQGDLRFAEATSSLSIFVGSSHKRSFAVGEGVGDALGVVID